MLPERQWMIHSNTQCIRENGQGGGDTGVCVCVCVWVFVYWRSSDVWGWTVGLHSDKRGESWLGWVKSPCWHIYGNTHTHTHKGKAWIGWRAYPLSLSPTNSLSCVPSHEHSMHQNLPSSEHGSTIIGEFHYRGKNYPSCLLVTSIQGILKAKQLFHLGLTKSVCPSLSKEPAD